MPKYADITGLLRANPKGRMSTGKFAPGVHMKMPGCPVERGEIVHVRPSDATVAEYIRIKAESICPDAILGSIVGQPEDERQGLVEGAKVKIACECIYHIERQ